MMIQMQPGQLAPLSRCQRPKSVMRAPMAVQPQCKCRFEIMQQALFFPVKIALFAYDERFQGGQVAPETGAAEYKPTHEGPGNKVSFPGRADLAQARFQRHIDMGEHLRRVHFAPSAG